MSVRHKIEGLRAIWQFDNRWSLAAARLLAPSRSPLTYRLGGLAFDVDHAHGDSDGIRHVLTSRMYRDHLDRLDLRGRLRVLDLGANTGGFPLLLALTGASIARLACVEMNPRTCERLRTNLTRNLRTDVVVINAAICGEARLCAVQLGPGSVGDSLYYASANATGETATVPGRPFDDIAQSAFGDEEIDLCKMDVESAEYEIVDSPAATLSRCRQIVLEIHDPPPGKSVHSVVEKIRDQGFETVIAPSGPGIFSFRRRAQ